MRSLPRFRSERKPRVFQGAHACVGWELTRDRVVHWCETCTRFHLSTGHTRDDVRSSCPRMAEGAKILLMTFGPVPFSILQAMYHGRFNPEARRELDRACGALDALIESEPVQ